MEAPIPKPTLPPDLPSARSLLARSQADDVRIYVSQSRRPPVQSAGDKGRLFNIASHLDARFGGIASSLPEFCRAMQGTGIPICWGVCSPEETVPDSSRLRDGSIAGGTSAVGI